MTDAEQMEELRGIIKGVLDRWSPFPSDPHELRVMRALLNLNAFEKDLAVARSGGRPIRTDYPIALLETSTDDKSLVLGKLDGSDDLTKELRAALADLVNIADHFQPPKAHEGACGSWANCDGQCQAHHYVGRSLERANAAIAKANKLLGNLNEKPTTKQ
jgi:hypothetical protein